MIVNSVYFETLNLNGTVVTKQHYYYLTDNLGVTLSLSYFNSCNSAIHFLPLPR